MGDFWNVFNDIMRRLGDDEDDQAGPDDSMQLLPFRPQSGGPLPDPVPLPYWYDPSRPDPAPMPLDASDPAASQGVSEPRQTLSSPDTGSRADDANAPGLASGPLAQYAANAPGSTTSTNNSCPANVRDFVNAHWQEAQKLADQLGNGVTPEEVLAVSGNETQWGQRGLFSHGNYFGLHGPGPEGTYYTEINHTPTPIFPTESGFMDSGQAFVNKVRPYMTPDIGNDPSQFYSVVHQHGWATPNANYAADMVRTSSPRGSYTLAALCRPQRP